jgi:hypothetical protein
MLIDRIVFGTARLTGGADRVAAERLLRMAIDGGIRHVDTAPPYGIGTAERVVGAMLDGRDDVNVTAKVGLAHPHFAVAKTWLRRARRLVRSAAASIDGRFEPTAEAAGNGRRFDPASLSRSFAITRARLRCKRVALLLLHEVHAEAATPAVIAWLERQRREGLAEAVGYSHGAMAGPRSNAVFPRDFLVQAAADPAWLSRDAQVPPVTRPLIVHSVALTADWVARRDVGSAAALARGAAMLAASMAQLSVTRTVAALAILAERLPEARFVVATTDERRLADYLRAIHLADRIGTPAILAEAMA